jgi:hypothetical protein
VDRGMLRYQLDQYPCVVAIATNLRFDQVPSGQHTVTVAVIGFDNRLITPEAKLRVKIP